MSLYKDIFSFFTKCVDFVGYNVTTLNKNKNIVGKHHINMVFFKPAKKEGNI